MEHNGVWREQFTIPAYMVDVNRKATLAAVCNILQDIAGRHAIIHKAGYHDMQTRGRFWALNRIKVVIHTPPMWQQTIRIQTWISSLRGPFSHRNFMVYDESDNLLVSACYLWFLVDVKTRRPTRIVNSSFTIFDGKIAACGLPDKIRPKKGDFQTDLHEVVFSDLDMIGHVNNVKYMEWLVDSSKKQEAFKNKQAKSLSLNYLTETVNGDMVEINQMALNETEQFYELKSRNSGKAICRAVLEWKE